MDWCRRAAQTQLAVARDSINDLARLDARNPDADGRAANRRRLTAAHLTTTQWRSR